MEIRPVKTEADYRAALDEASGLMDAAADTPEGDRLDLLATLIEHYEARHFPIEAPDPIAAIEFMMEQKGLTRRDLEPAIGSRGRVSEILTRKRPLTLAMIRELSPLLSLPADVLIRPYELAARDITEAFRLHYPHETNAVCTFEDGKLRLVVENDYDPEGLNLMDEFSDNLCAFIGPFDGDIRLISVETLG
jgi:HTH-type transcriptional regulator/antitoxin HigA